MSILEKIIQEKSSSISTAEKMLQALNKATDEMLNFDDEIRKDKELAKIYRSIQNIKNKLKKLK